MLLAGAPSIRDVIAFPKTAQAQCALTGAGRWECCTLSRHVRAAHCVQLPFSPSATTYSPSALRQPPYLACNPSPLWWR